MAEGTKTCIYCLERKPDAEFNREHVIPQAFGTFDSSNLVLECVCCECNQFFGDSIDLKLARDSAEGLDRYHSGMKPTREFKGYGRRSTTVAEIKEGPMAGIRCHLRPNPTNGILGMKPLPYIGLAQENVEGGRIHWFPAEEVPERKTLAEFGFVKGRELLLHMREMSWEDARALLAPKGYELLSEPVLTQPPEGETLATETIVIIGRPEQRAVAKIGFNYLACVGGSALARAVQFDDIRDFVRHDRGRPPVHPTENVIGLLIDGKPVAKGPERVNEIETA